MHKDHQIEDTTPMSNQNKRTTKKDLAGQAEQILKCSKRAIYKEKKENEIELQEAVLTVRKKLASALKPILKSDIRINDALKVEKEFLKKARNEMSRRRGGPPPPPRRA